MNLDAAKKLIEKYTAGHAEVVEHMAIAERYYRGENDILSHKPSYHRTVDNEGRPCLPDPMRQADNRIPHPFHQLLVNQKAAYMFTTPPQFDVKNDAANKIIVDSLGDGYGKKAKDLCVAASNAGIAWVHYWEADGFNWGVVPAAEVIPVWSTKLDHTLLAVLRAYKHIDDNGDTWDVYEYWNEAECQAFRKQGDLDTLMYWPCFVGVAGANEEGDTYSHSFGRVPFIPFQNNNIARGDLPPVKRLIDTYDKTYSGFMNDLEDIQEVLFVLTGYGDEDAGRFLRQIKRFKMVALDNGGVGDPASLSTLTIDIPVEAREKMLEITRKAIFDLGQGIDPQQQGLDATSGEAMKFLYALLELKAGMMETEFRLGFNELIRAILQHHHLTADNIIQTWTRTSIRNDAELVDMCSKSEGIISRKTILKNHPFVENVEDEETELDAEEQKRQEQADIYNDGDSGGGEDDV